MSSFSREIDRLFEELVHEVWRGTPRQPRQLPSESSLEFEVPTRGAGHEDIAFTTEGQNIVVTIRRHASEGLSATGARVVRDAEHFQQTFTLPAGAEVAAMEVRFEHHTLRIRVTLRKRTFSMERP